MKKRILSILLAFCLCLSLLPTVALAEGPDVWDGSTKAPSGGGKSESDPYLISTGEELAWLATRDAEVSYFVKLTNDIILNDGTFDSDGNLSTSATPKEWTPAPKAVWHIDGNNHYISGMYINSNDGDNVGLFSYLYGYSYPRGYVRDLTIKNSYVRLTRDNPQYGNGYAGIFAGKSFRTEYTNCFSENNIVSTNCYATGGIVGSSEDDSFNGVHTSGSISGSNSLGGLAGMVSYDSVFKNCWNEASVTGGKYCGGIVGDGRNSSDYYNCANLGSGGITGSGGRTFKNCYNLSEVESYGGADALLATLNDNLFEMDAESGLNTWVMGTGGYPLPTGDLFVDDTVYYDIWLDGVRVGERNQADILKNGLASYDKDTNTLYLHHGLVVTKAYNESLLYTKGDINLCVDGSVEFRSAQNVGSGPSVIKLGEAGGSGKLKISAPDGESAAVTVTGAYSEYGINVNSLTLDGDVCLTVRTKEAGCFAFCNTFTLLSSEAVLDAENISGGHSMLNFVYSVNLPSTNPQKLYEGTGTDLKCVTEFTKTRKTESGTTEPYMYPHIRIAPEVYGLSDTLPKSLTVSMTEANTEAALSTWAAGQIRKGDITASNSEITVSGVVPAVAGSYADPDGTDGSFTVTVKLTQNDISKTTTIPGTITATAYVAPTYTVTINAGANMTLASGSANQSGLSDAMTDTVYTAADGCYFPTDYSVAAVNGISVTRNSYTQITVSGTPTANTTITLAPATAKTKEDTPTATFDAQGPDFGNLNGISQGIKYSLDGGITWTEHTSSDTNKAISGVSADKDIKVYMPASDSTKLDSDIQTIDVTKSATPTGVIGVACTTSANNDGKLQNVTTAMEYKKSDASSWTDCDGTEVTGLSNGTYYVRVKATGTVLASDNQTVTVAAYTAPPHIHCVCGGDTAVGDHSSHTNVTWTGVSSLGEITGPGSYYLTDDILMNSNLDITGTVDLCLNGHQIYTQPGGRSNTVRIQAGAALNVCDCSEDERGLITTCRGEYAIENSGTLNLYSGSVERSSDDNGAAVKVNAGAVFNMYGGKIVGNAKAIITDGTVHVFGGTVSAKREAVYAKAGSEVTVSDNAALSVTGTSYSAIAIYGGAVNIRGGTVTNDFSSAVYVPYGGESTLNISGGEISTASSAKTDTIRLNSDSVEVTVTGGSITNGYAYPATSGSSLYGWAIGVYKVKSLTISGAPVINRIYLADSYRITVGEDGLTYETPIEIHCAKCPAPVTGANDTDYSSKFTPRSSFYAIINAEDNVVLFTKAATVTYTDGVDTEEIFPDQTHNTYLGQPTPAFNGTPQRPGYTFGGWYTDKDCTDGNEYDFDTPVTENITLYAKWDHTHSYGSDWKSDADKHWHECTDASCPDKTGSVKDQAAHTASGWIIDTPATATTDGTKHKECTDCKRVLETGTISATGYTITFDAGKGTASVTSAQTDKDGKLTSLPTASRSGYRFNGWYTKAFGGEKITTSYQFTDNTKVYAHWTKKTTSGSSGSGSNSGTTIIQSAKTADIGGMIYGMTALLSLTGGAWIINKKRKGK